MYMYIYPKKEINIQTLFRKIIKNISKQIIFIKETPYEYTICFSKKLSKNEIKLLDVILT